MCNAVVCFVWVNGMSKRREYVCGPCVVLTSMRVVLCKCNKPTERTSPNRRTWRKEKPKIEYIYLGVNMLLKIRDELIALQFAFGFAFCSILVVDIGTVYVYGVRFSSTFLGFICYVSLRVHDAQHTTTLFYVVAFVFICCMLFCEYRVLSFAHFAPFFRSSCIPFLFTTLFLFQFYTRAAFP